MTKNLMMFTSQKFDPKLMGVGMKKWHKIDPSKSWLENGIPTNSTFILYDDRRTSGLSIYEALYFKEDNVVQCPAIFEEYFINDFSHWRHMIKLPRKE